MVHSIVEGWETATYTSTWTSAEFGALITAIAIYSLVVIVSLAAFGLYAAFDLIFHQSFVNSSIWRLRQVKTTKKAGTDLPLIAIGPLALLLICMSSFADLLSDLVCDSAYLLPLDVLCRRPGGLAACRCCLQ